MITPKITWAALGTGLISLAVTASPIVHGLIGIPGPIVALFGPELGPRISAACAVISAICLAVTARGRSIDPGTDAAVVTPSEPSITIADLKAQNPSLVHVIPSAPPAEKAP